MKRDCSLFLIATIFVLLLCTLPAFARGVIGGSVVDREGNPVAKVKVAVRPFDNPSLRNYPLKTNGKGAFFVWVDNGEYKVVLEDKAYGLDTATIRIDSRMGKPVPPPGEEDADISVPDGKLRTVFAWKGKAEPGRPIPPVAIGTEDKATVDLVIVDKATLNQERSEMLLVRVVGALQREDRAAARRTVNDLLENTPEDPLGLTLRAYIRAEDGDYEGAEADVSRALEQQPDMYDARYQLAAIYRSTDRTEEALAAFHQAAEAAETGSQKAKALLSIGEMERDAGNTETAIEILEQAIAADPQLRSAVAPELADLHTKAGNIDRAAELLDTAGDEEIDPALQYNLGVVHFNKREWEPAVECFTKVVTADPGMAQAHQNLATSLLNLGRREEAVAHFREYLALRPDADDAEQMQALIDALSQ